MSQSLILASSSPARRALMDKLGLPYQALSPNIDETAHDGETAEQLVTRLSREKAQALAADFPASLIIGSDQCGTLGSVLLGKPGTHDKAVQQLKACRGQTITFYTGLALYCHEQNISWQGYETFDVSFRTYSDAEIAGYLKKEQPFHCAGSFQAEGLGICLFSKLQGRDPNTLIGLPLMLLSDVLRQMGINPLLD